jgi:hypothetical protein
MHLPLWLLACTPIGAVASIAAAAIASAAPVVFLAVIIVCVPSLKCCECKFGFAERLLWDDFGSLLLMFEDLLSPKETLIKPR